MEERIKKEIAYLEMELDDHQQRRDRLVSELKGDIQTYTDYQVVTFLPGKIKDIAYERQKISEISDQIRMLRHLLANAG